MTQTDPTEPGRDLRAVPDNDDPRAVAEAILFEVRRVIVTQEEQEVTSWFAAGALSLVVVAAGLSAVWFGRLP